MRTNIIMATDGACSHNPGPGGYAAILRFGEAKKEIVGYEPKATNNSMELKAVVEGVRQLNRPCNIVVQTDSHYVCTGIANAPIWAKNGWKLTSGQIPKNIELWKELQALAAKGNHTLHYEYVKGHSGNPDNERCDQLAKEQIKLHTKGA